jgi:hypothetical protein
MEFGVILYPEGILALVDEVHQISLAMWPIFMGIDQFQSLGFLLYLSNLLLLFSEEHLLSFRYLLFFSLKTNTIKQLKLLVARTELGVDTLLNILQISHYSDTLFDLSSFVIDTSELDVIMGNGDVSRVIIEVKRA